MKEQAGSHRRVVDLVLNEVSEVIRSQDEDLQIYTSGATNIFKYPELSDTEKASQLISTLEHKELLRGLIDEQQQNKIDDPDNEIKLRSRA